MARFAIQRLTTFAVVKLARATRFDASSRRRLPRRRGSFRFPSRRRPVSRDDGQRTVTLPAHVERVMPAGPPASVDLLIMAPEKLAGLTRGLTPAEAAFLPSRAGSLPTLGRLTGRGNTMNLEAVVKRRPISWSISAISAIRSSRSPIGCSSRPAFPTCSSAAPSPRRPPPCASSARCWTLRRAPRRWRAMPRRRWR